MQRNVRLVSDHPGVVTGRDVEDLACAHFDYVAIAHRGGGAAGNDHAYMFDLTFFLSQGFADMFGPALAGFVRGPANGHAAESDNFKSSLFKCADFVREFKALEDDFVHIHSIGNPTRGPH